MPGLPRVLLIGDSISIGYTLPTRELLDGKANVHRIPTNGGPTTRGLEQLDRWLGDSRWDVIHFNFGLHDLKRADAKGTLVDVSQGPRQVDLDALGCRFGGPAGFPWGAVRDLLERMHREGLAESTGTRWRLTGRGRLLADAVGSEILSTCNSASPA